MKKFAILSALFCLIASAAELQVYGQHRYRHDSVCLSSARITTNSAGWVFSGYRTCSQAFHNRYDFAINKVDAMCGFGGATEFSVEYRISDNVICGTPNRVYNCRGVYVIPTSNFGTGEAYALAGV